MFPSSGVFAKTACPFYKTGLCERPHCHFLHLRTCGAKSSEKVSQSKPQASKSVPAYVPTPKAELTSRPETSSRLIGDAADNTKQTTVQKINSSKSEIAPYIPTPKEDLKRKLSQSDASNDGDKFKRDLNVGPAKKRVAHQSSDNGECSASLVPQPKKLNARAMMEKRFELADVKSDNAEFDPLATNKNKKRLAHGIKKEFVSGASSSTSRPSVLHERGSKIPVAVRQKSLDLLVDELLKYCEAEDAFVQAKTFEKEALARAGISRQIYTNVIAGKVRQIRQTFNTASLSSSKSANSVSHEAILNGKIHGQFTRFKKVFLTIDSLSADKLHDHLLKYTMSPEKLKIYGFPLIDVTDPTRAILPPIESGKKVNDYSTRNRVCARCKKPFLVDEQGIPTRKETCIYHSGRIWTERFNRSLEKIFSCCRGDQLSGGCMSAASHVVDGYGHPLHNQGFVKTQEKDISDGNYGIYAIDCEMVYTTVGFELTRVSVVDHKFNSVYEKFCLPSHPILDYNTKFSGINEDDLIGVTCTLRDVQNDLLEIFNSRTLLLGHSLESDMKALKMIHSTIIDTSEVFPHKRGLPFKRALRTLMSEVLHQIIQDSVEGHDSKEDAKSVMQLMLSKLEQDLKRLSR